MALGTHIRRIREERGLTQEQLAEAAGITPRGLMYIEHGRREPGYRTLVRLATALGQSLVIPLPDGQGGAVG